MTSFHILVDYLKDKIKKMNRPVVVTPDLGFAKKARNFAERMNTPLAFIEKRRVANDANAQALTLIGDVKDRDVVIIDDEVDTGGSMVQAVEACKAHGARHIVHPVLSSNAAERLGGLPVDEYITTDTIPIPDAKAAHFGSRLTTLTVSNLLAEVILRANQGRSVGAMFNE